MQWTKIYLNKEKIKWNKWNLIAINKYKRKIIKQNKN